MMTNWGSLPYCFTQLKDSAFGHYTVGLQAIQFVLKYLRSLVLSSKSFSHLTLSVALDKKKIWFSFLTLSVASWYEVEVVSWFLLKWDKWKIVHLPFLLCQSFLNQCSQMVAMTLGWRKVEPWLSHVMLLTIFCDIPVQCWDIQLLSLKYQKNIVLENVKAGYKHLYWRAMLHVSGALVWRWFPKRLQFRLWVL